MNDQPQILGEVLSYLKALQRDGIAPPEARAGLRRLQERHPGSKLNLVWEEQTYDRSFHYDALVRRDGEGTFVLSFCPERVLPWAVRGVRHWKEADLVRVNSFVLTFDHAVSCLEHLWNDANITTRLINLCLIQEALDQEPVTVSDEDVQQAMDNFRRQHKLFKAEDLHTWLTERGMVLEQLQSCLVDDIMGAKLRDRIAGGRVEEYFAAHRDEFDIVSVAQLTCSDEKTARQIAEQVRAGTVDFLTAAQAQFLAAVQRGLTPPKSLFEVVRRGMHMPRELENEIFAVSPNELVGPVLRDGSWTLIRVLARTPAKLDDVTRHAIKKRLFEDWLTQRRQTAVIEWNWGKA